MKHIALSQRHDYIPEYNEYRDGLDCRWADFFWQEKILILPLPNHIKIAMGWLQEISIEALIITGGGNLEKYGGLTDKREKVERQLIKYCIEKRVPVIGVCYGMQLITDFFGGKLVKIAGHVRTRHRIYGDYNAEVNSYHNYAVKEPPSKFIALSYADDGTVEIFRHEKMPILGMMFHPERENFLQKNDIQLFLKIINSPNI